eukprot:304044_1
MAATQVEGSNDTNITPSKANTFYEWLSQWDFVDVSTVHTSLEKEGIKSRFDFKKYVTTQHDFDKLMSRLQFNFVNEKCLEIAWKSTTQKIIEQKPNQNQSSTPMAHQDVEISEDIKAIQVFINTLSEQATQCKTSLNSELNIMIEIIEQCRIKLTNDVDQRQAQKQKRLEDICAELSIIQGAINEEKEDKMLLNYSSIPFIDTISHKPLDRKRFETEICRMMEIQHNVSIYSMKYRHKIINISNENDHFSEFHGSIHNVAFSNSNKKVTLLNNGNSTVFCKRGWNEGIHSIKIMCEYSKSTARCIGVISSVDAKFGGNGCDLSNNGISYMLRCVSYSSTEIKGSKNHGHDHTTGKTILQQNIKNMKWLSGEAVVITLDCNQWTVQFSYNNQIVAKIDIESKQTYYFVVLGTKDRDINANISFSIRGC